MADGDDRKDEVGEDDGLPDFIDTEDEGAEEASARPDEEPQGEDVAASGAGAPAVHPAVRVQEDTEDPTIHVKPHADGLFETVEVPEGDLPVLDPDDAPGYGSEKRSKLAFGIIAGTLLAVAAGAVFIATQDERRQEVREFLAGSIVDHKTAEIEQLRKKWRDEDRRATNRYGDVTLTYFPPDATVTVKQVKYHQDGEPWRKQQAVEPEQVDEQILPNRTAELEEGETVERLPLLNMPIFETDRGEDGQVSDVYTYEYVLTFSREGYEEREITWKPGDWERVGPGNRAIAWDGLDLVPKPETLKENFAAAMKDVYCLMQKKEIGTLQEAVEDDNFDMLLKRNGFKTQENFHDAFGTLTAGEHAEWWKERQAEIQKGACEDDAE